ncbi:MAG: VanZ family protein [Gemmatimonadaceae bacterium]
MAQRRQIGYWRSVVRPATVAVIVGILIVTLRPVGSRAPLAFNWCIGCTELGTLDLLYNIALFVPLGVLLGLRGVNALQGLVLAAVLSLSIEVLQLVAVRGRDPSLSDVIANSLGGALGVPLSRAGTFFRRATAGQWRVLAWSWVALSLATIVLGSWVVTVPVPESDYYVQWTPQRPGYSRFAGELHTFQANGVALAPGTRVPAREFPREFFEIGPDASARLTAGARNSGIAMIARLALEHGEFFMLGRQGDALVVRYRSHAPQVGIRSPIFALAGAFDGDPLGELEVQAIRRRHSVELRSTRANSGANAARTEQVTAARFWAALLPFDRGFGSLGVLGDVLWMAILVAPAAFAGMRGHVGVARVLAPVAVAAGLAFLAGFVQPSLWWWPVWLGVVGGALIGIRFGRDSS